MPVLVNNDTGFAENLPDVDAEYALDKGTHGIPLNNPQGEPVVASKDQVPQLLQQGHTQPGDEQLQSLLDQAKYSSPTEQLKSLAEGAASAATFGGSTGVESALFHNQEEQNKRREINPIEREVIGPIAGLVATTPLGGLGAAGLMGRAGEAAVTGLRLNEYRLGSAAVKGAVETALMSAGDEASKMFASDPDASAGAAVSHVMLNGLLGGGVGLGLGAVSPLWEATGGTKLGKMLGQIKDRAEGLIGTNVVRDIDDLAGRAGVNLPGGLKPALADNPDLKNTFQNLVESETTGGEHAREALLEGKKELSEKLLETLGKTPEDLSTEFSEADAGNKLKKSLIAEVKDTFQPLTEQFTKVKAAFKNTELDQAAKTDLSNKLGAIQQEYAVSPSSPEFKKIGQILEEIPNAQNLEQLRNLQSIHLGDIQRQQLFKIAGPVRTALRDSEESVIRDKLAAEAPQLIPEHEAARASYRDAITSLDSLNDRLHVGHYEGAGGFAKKLSEMTPEDVLRRLTPGNDSELLSTLSEKFPQTAQAVREQYLNKLADVANTRVPQGALLNAKNVFSTLERQWSPELKQFALSPETQTRLDAIKSLLKSLPERKNPSGTARTGESMLSHWPAAAMGMVSALTGHNPLVGAVLGQIGKFAAKDVPDAVKWSMLKYLGEGKPINIRGFKSMIDLTAAIANGESAINRSSKAIFKAGQTVIPQNLKPTDRAREKLDKKLQDLQSNTDPLMHVGGESGYYLPDHASALSATSARAVQYLNSLRPGTPKLGPLDPEVTPSKEEMAVYYRALDVGNQPLLALEAIKQGRLTPQDVQTVQTIYPGLYSHMVQKLTNEMVNHVSKGNSIPYATRTSLSLFLGQPLDSSMTPQAIMSAQPKLPPGPQGGGPVPHAKQHGSMKDLGKLATSFQTQGQAREQNKLQRA